jgi:hypothetical protein
MPPPDAIVNHMRSLASRRMSEAPWLSVGFSPAGRLPASFVCWKRVNSSRAGS